MTRATIGFLRSPFYLENIGMTQLIPALVAWMSLVSGGVASLTPLKELPPFGKEVPQISASKLSARAMEQKAGKEAEPEFVVTRQTEVFLNGKPCKYDEIPHHASIVRMEVAAADKKTVLKIHFRTRK
jgi:hypothetical protein